VAISLSEPSLAAPVKIYNVLFAWKTVYVFVLIIIIIIILIGFFQAASAICTLPAQAS
jgi:hypothetical protein